MVPVYFILVVGVGVGVFSVLLGPFFFFFFFFLAACCLSLADAMASTPLSPLPSSPFPNTKDGTLLAVGNQDTDTVAIFEFDPEAGSEGGEQATTLLRLVATLDVVSPACLQWV